jgi:GDPmannose 4,6-dehydratase
VKRALLTGITGQDGSYLAELLLREGYEVHGVVRGGPEALHAPRLEALRRSDSANSPRLRLHLADLEDAPALRHAVSAAAPDEVYHLASQSQPGLSFEQVETTARVTGLGTLRLLEIVRALPRPPRFFHASSSEVFGRPARMPQDETTPFAPITPYGCAKAFATHLVRVYRQAFGLFAVNGIFYNHESPRRGAQFVTQKICRAAAAIQRGVQSELVLGDTAARRDWGHARDYVHGMWLALQQDAPDDFIFATGQLHSVQDVVELAFGKVGLDWHRCVRQDPALLRPADPTQLVGNAAKARRVLGWKPTTTFEQLISEMTEAALAEAAGSGLHGHQNPAQG